MISAKAIEDCKSDQIVKHHSSGEAGQQCGLAGLQKMRGENNNE